MAPCATSSSPMRLSRCSDCALMAASSCACDDAALHEDVADAVAPIDDGRVADLAGVEIDVAEVRAVGDGETAGLPSHREELQYVGEARLLQAALDGHQRISSTSRLAASGHSHTSFSSSRK